MGIQKFTKRLRKLKQIYNKHSSGRLILIALGKTNPSAARTFNNPEKTQHKINMIMITEQAGKIEHSQDYKLLALSGALNVARENLSLCLQKNELEGLICEEESGAIYFCGSESELYDLKSQYNFFCYPDVAELADGLLVMRVF